MLRVQRQQLVACCASGQHGALNAACRIWKTLHASLKLGCPVASKHDVSVAVNKARDDCASVTTDWLCFGVLINLILWTAPNNLAVVVGYKACIINNAERTISD